MSTTVAKLLAQKRELMDRLEQDPGPYERAEIEQLLAKIDAALNLLDDADPSAPIPKFVSYCGSTFTNFGIKGALANYMILVRFRI